MQPLSIDGAWLAQPPVFPDSRGLFSPWFSGEEFRKATGHDLALRQANLSVSARGVLRGVHFADVPPSQAKYVTCVRGALLDVVVDIRVGSPTYRQWEAVRLDEETRHAVYLSEGLGHAVMALTDDATLLYLCSEGFAPTREHGVHPLDPALGIDWPADLEPLLSDKDAAAPTLAEAEHQGLLPSYADCQAYREQLRSQAG
ncbi:dTDP-4-dehydrorhamnose 3,5-epimerase family protein [Actinopolymorpha singaporensis]|uniref:dTDP-4-dehydrorhamnose 3,5-epimerase n=1 Tax=Actinopolymorpha singaporensis TaxID=117157 RepID=A0A1H1XS23_9ACTN|nr:dTDP-4-dehydrorhamnose 3,5-epimerase [Actinopolymorpha singaporensis]SDT11952.1 dTDP-4-dehydrorhamnose 3,5-epimerase [Actinopolymorpha singaporensis]